MSTKEDVQRIQQTVKIYTTSDKDIVLDTSTSKEDLLSAALLMWEEIEAIKTRLRVDYKKIHDELFPKAF